MSLPKQIIVKESLRELKDLQRKSGELISKRLRILIEFKKHEKTGISKRAVSENTGINHNSITKWRTVYLKEGIQLNGDKFLLEMPFCTAANFQIFMDEFSQQNPLEFKIIVLDNGAFHKAKSLKIPSNICLIFLPPYSPELNPAEKMWATIKRNFTNQFFKNLDEISAFIEKKVKALTQIQIITTCNYEYAFVSAIWTI